jgi:hypothetical protein
VLWAPVEAGQAATLAAAVLEDVRTRFAPDGIEVEVALATAPARPGDDPAQALAAAAAALAHDSAPRAA